MHYHRLSVISVLSTALLACLGAPLEPRWDDMLVKHTWDDVPSKWESLGSPAGNTTIDLHFALKPHRENALVDALFDVSDPRRSTHVLLTAHSSARACTHVVTLSIFRYGAHLSREQVAQLVAPHPDTFRLVKSWLQHHGLSSSISMTHGGGWMTVTGVPVSLADDLLGASYQLYRYTGTNETNKTILRTVSYALPAVLHAHVQTVSPTTYFAPPHTLQQTPRKLSREDVATKANAIKANAISAEPLAARWGAINGVVPEFVRWLYKTTNYVPTSPDNVLAVVGFESDLPSQEDLTVFMTNLRTGAEDATFVILPVNGGPSEYNPMKPSLEANMDIQYAEAITYPVQHVYYSAGGQAMANIDNNEPSRGDRYLEWLNYILSQQYIPQTISISYGVEERIVPLEYAIALCELFVHLGARGTSVLFASGDDGVGPEECRDDSGDAQFVPNFPASCTCSIILSLLASTEYKFAYQISTVSQVPLLQALAALRASCPRSRRASPGAASRTIFNALPTRMLLCTTTSNVPTTCVTAGTSAFSLPWT